MFVSYLFCFYVIARINDTAPKTHFFKRVKNAGSPEKSDSFFQSSLTITEQQSAMIMVSAFGLVVQIGIDRLVRADHHGDQYGQDHFKVIPATLEKIELRGSTHLASTP